MSIDWSNFDAYSESTCYCRCMAIFRSHARFVANPEPGLVSRKPCPKCGSTDHLFRVSSDQETEVLSPGDVEKIT